jgi:GTP-binding protein EngB required for normal cell division
MNRGLNRLAGLPTHDRYLDSLERCQQIAREEFKAVSGYFQRCDSHMARLVQAYDALVQGTPGGDGGRVRGELRKLQVSLQTRYVQLQALRQRNLLDKRKQFDLYHVMLFGRTMAGKSTIREAITRGDGSTIGKGAQRTTRDVREYTWNKLKIVDTPGFGAFGGEEDTQVAREVLERVDTVLFMLNSDSIQETTFEELEHIRRLNKPVMFVLNVKKDLENVGNRRRALRDPAKYVYKEDDLAEHVRRLEQLMQRAGMNPAHVRIIPIHAQAAFLSTRSADEEREALSRLSRLDELLAALCLEIELHGPVRRVQSFLDTALHHIGSQLGLLLAQVDELEKLQPQYEAGKNRIAAWRGKLQRDLPRLLRSEVNDAFKPLEDSVADFVDDHIEKEGFEGQWKRHCEKLKIEQDVESRAHALAEQLTEELAEFGKEMTEGISLGAAMDQTFGAKGFDAWDYKRIGGWGSAIIGVLSTIAFLNSWNPVGWALAGVAALFSFASIFSDSRSSKLRQAKQQARDRLLESVDDCKKKTRETLQQWVDKRLIGEMIVGAEQQLNAFASGLAVLQKAIRDTRADLGQLEAEINARLLHRTAYLLSGSHQALPDLRRLVRTPGFAFYALVADGLRDTALLRRMGEVLKERIELVAEGPSKSILERLFRGLAQSVEMVGEREAVLHAYRENLPKILGKQHRRIKLAAALTRCNIQTKEVENRHA